MIRGRRAGGAASVAAAIFLWIAPSCALSSADALSNGECGAGEKACVGGDDALKCVTAQDPEVGCAARAGCAPCALNNATAICAPDGTCAIAACNQGYADCNTGSDPANAGCETNIVNNGDGKNCNGCNKDCPAVKNGTVACVSRNCAVSACDVGFDDCNHDAHDGCEADLRTDATCGNCTTSCTAPETCQLVSGKYVCAAPP